MLSQVVVPSNEFISDPLEAVDKRLYTRSKFNRNNLLIYLLGIKPDILSTLSDQSIHEVNLDFLLSMAVSKRFAYTINYGGSKYILGCIYDSSANIKLLSNRLNINCFRFMDIGSEFLKPLYDQMKYQRVDILPLTHKRYLDTNYSNLLEQMLA